MSISRSRCPACGYALGGEIPDDVDLGEKKDTDLPDYKLGVYQGENANRKKRPADSDDDDAKRAALAKALRDLENS